MTTVKPGIVAGLYETYGPVGGVRSIRAPSILGQSPATLRNAHTEGWPNSGENARSQTFLGGCILGISRDFRKSGAFIGSPCSKGFSVLLMDTPL